MSEVIERERVTRNFICSRDTYLQLKADIKALYSESKDHNKHKEYLLKRKEWAESVPSTEVPRFVKKGLISRPNPEWTAYNERIEEWKARNPGKYLDWIWYIRHYYNDLEDHWIILSERARALHLVYGIIKGRPYLQMEPKIGEYNKPDWGLMDEVCKHYGIDFNLISGYLMEAGRW